MGVYKVILEDQSNDNLSIMLMHCKVTVNQFEVITCNDYTRNFASMAILQYNISQ